LVAFANHNFKEIKNRYGRYFSLLLLVNAWVWRARRDGEESPSPQILSNKAWLGVPEGR